MQAKTVQHSIEFSGKGLHSGESVNVRILPDSAGLGIRFIRTDLPDAPAISSRDVDFEGMSLCTTLRKGDAKVHTTEHLMSALAALGVTDCEIQIDGAEIPGMDGCAKRFIELIQETGVQTLNRRIEPLVVTKKVSKQYNAASIEAEPCDSGFHVSYTLHYPNHKLLQGTYSFELTPENFAREIAPARTFLPHDQLKSVQAAGQGQGGTVENAVVVDGDRTVLGTQLRFPDEPVRHKILDLIGDFYIIGRPIQGRITAHLSGHTANLNFVLELLKQESQS